MNTNLPLSALILGLGILLAPPHAASDGLPALGESSQADVSPAMERRIGEKIMHEIRRDPTWLDDAEIDAYLNRLGSRLAAHSEGARQDFELFALRDPTLNAFAMPGGYIGVHSGLILAAESESELASVLAHEISHVTQHHMARSVGVQGQSQMAAMVAMALALLASRSSSDLAIGAAMVGQAVGIQNQLNYSRDFEREADRLGLTVLERAGFDIRGMNSFFERMLKFGRLYENNAPGYLRTHPLTTERMADLGNRIQGRPYKQVADSLDFLLVRAKLRSQLGTPQEAVTDFLSRLENETKATAATTGRTVAWRYGLVLSQMRAGNFTAAQQGIDELRRLKESPHTVSPLLETTAAQLRLKQGDAPGAVHILRAAQSRYPQERAVAYGLVEALLAAGTPAEALRVASDDLASYAADGRMHGLQAKTYAMLGQRLQQHRAQAEAYALQGQLSAAIEQLHLAQKAGDGNFYEQSQVDARLREFRKRMDEAKLLKKTGKGGG
ncbi:MAG TPA: M48 family metalloprotease [Rhodocyclaceae bacterium]|nr:M48 family metalloprotease [Rhodocyclaceae bacterium]